MAGPHAACRGIAKTFRFFAGPIGHDILLGLRNVSGRPARRVAHQGRRLSRLSRPLRDDEYHLHFCLWHGYFSADRAFLSHGNASRESVLVRCLAGARFVFAILGSYAFTARVTNSSLPRLCLVGIRKIAVRCMVERKCDLAITGPAGFSSIRLYLAGPFPMAR